MTITLYMLCRQPKKTTLITKHYTQTRLLYPFSPCKESGRLRVFLEVLKVLKSAPYDHRTANECVIRNATDVSVSSFMKILTFVIRWFDLHIKATVMQKKSYSCITVWQDYQWKEAVSLYKSRMSGWAKKFISSVKKVHVLLLLPWLSLAISWKKLLLRSSKNGRTNRLGKAKIKILWLMENMKRKLSQISSPI